MIGQRRLARPSREDVPVRNPATGTFLPTEGDVVVVDIFWMRRRRDQDVDLLPVPPVNADGERIAPPVPTEPNDEPASTDAPMTTEDAPARARRTGR